MPSEVNDIDTISLSYMTIGRLLNAVRTALYLNLIASFPSLTLGRYMYTQTLRDRLPPDELK